MKTIPFSFTAITFLTGCASLPDQHGVPENASALWQKGAFSIVFQAGPVSFGEDRSFSSFQISRQFEGLSVPTTIVVESPQNIDHFRWIPASKPSDYINFFLSDSGLTMLIEETVPNECAPCTNYVLVRADEKDTTGRQLTSVYLSFPKGKVSVKGTFPDEAKVTELTDTHVSYYHPDGTRKTQPFKALIKPAQRPRFPG